LTLGFLFLFHSASSEIIFKERFPCLVLEKTR
jgi:hypothetical protein